MSNRRQFSSLCLAVLMLLVIPCQTFGQATGPTEYIPNDPRLDLSWARIITLLKAWAKVLEIEQTSQVKMQQAVIVHMEDWVDVSHPELQSQFLSQLTFNATDQPYANSQTHGTSAAGIGAAAVDNAMGVAGVGGFMGRIKFISIKVCDDQLCKPEWVMAGLRKVLEYKRAGIPIVVIGCNFLTGADDSVATDTVLKDLAAEGIAIVAPASNSSPPQNLDESTLFPVTYARTYSNIIPVAAGDASVERLAPFSGYGRNTLRLIASGENVPTVSVLDPNGSARMSGNSAVTNQIASAFAMVRVYREPNLLKALEILYFTARMFPELEGKLKTAPGSGDDAGRMAGRIDIYDALTLAFGCPAPSSAITWVTRRDTNQLIATDSVYRAPGPFAVDNPLNFFASDRKTRITAYAYIPGLMPSDTASSVVVQAQDSAGHIVTLPTEFLGPLPNPLSCVSQLNINLQPQAPQPSLAVGEVTLTITVHGQTSGPGKISIRSSQ